MPIPLLCAGGIVAKDKPKECPGISWDFPCMTDAVAWNLSTFDLESILFAFGLLSPFLSCTAEGSNGNQQ